jgi:FtsH-binding integral membrane protein
MVKMSFRTKLLGVTLASLLGIAVAKSSDSGLAKITGVTSCVVLGMNTMMYSTDRDCRYAEREKVTKGYY